jgi:hypothetical protein
MGFMDKLAAAATKAIDKADAALAAQQQQHQPPQGAPPPPQVIAQPGVITQQQQGAAPQQWVQPGAPVPAPAPARQGGYAPPTIYQVAQPPPPPPMIQQPPPPPPPQCPSFFSPQQAIPVAGPPPPPPPPFPAAAVPRPLAAPGGGPPAPPRRKKALLVGVAYFNTQSHLRGTINDVQCLCFLLKNRFGFEDENIVMLRDDDPRPAFQPTYLNIQNACRWLTGDARAGDSLFFSFSGHGSQLPDPLGEEADGMDETILPVDHKRAGQIRDTQLNQWLVAPLPAGATLHVVVDSCHSGTVLDLPYSITWGPSGAPAWSQVGHRGTAGGVAFHFSACSDHQTAADTNRLAGDASTGAATFCFIHAIETFGVNQTYATLLAHMDEVLRSLGKTSITPASGGQQAIGAAAPLALGLALGPVGLLAGMALGGQVSRGKASHQKPVLNCSAPLDIHRMTLSL